MNSFAPLAAFAFYGLLAGLLVTAVLTVTVRSLFHAAIFLAFTLLGAAIVYFFLHAEFLAGIQILVYVGAIMTLVIFAIMLTSKIGDPAVSQVNRQKYPALVLILLLGFCLIRSALKTTWAVGHAPKAADAISIGKALMGEFVFPFEVISLVLLVALIGAIVVARSDQ
jgi:NADH-quinone oxidoreductase subunit J